VLMIRPQQRLPPSLARRRLATKMARDDSPGAARRLGTRTARTKAETQADLLGDSPEQDVELPQLHLRLCSLATTALAWRMAEPSSPLRSRASLATFAHSFRNAAVSARFVCLEASAAAQGMVYSFPSQDLTSFSACSFA
jgi:hypothetical protein